MIGSDVVDTITLTGNDPDSGYPSINYLSVPITGDYGMAFDIVTDIEGGTGSTGNGEPNNINSILMYDPTSQGFSNIASYAPGPIPAEGWVGDFVIPAGAGIAITLKDVGADWTYPWTISLITPVVP